MLEGMAVNKTVTSLVLVVRAGSLCLGRVQRSDAWEGNIIHAQGSTASRTRRVSEEHLAAACHLPPADLVE